MAALDFPAAPSVDDIYTANGRTWKWNGSSWIGGSGGAGSGLATIACRIRRTTDLTVASGAGSPVLITWDTEDEDTDTMHSTVSNTDQIVFTTAGLYMVEVQLVWAATTATGNFNVYALKNGNTFTETHKVSTLGKHSAGSSVWYQNFHFVIRAAASDYIIIGLFQNTGTDRTLTASGAVPITLTATRLAA